MALRHVVMSIDRLELLPPNEFQRMHFRERGKHRAALRVLVKKHLSGFVGTPMKHAKITIYMTRSKLLDVDNKYGSLKSLLDVLQPFHKSRCPDGLGIIQDDTDGENDNGGCVRSLRVMQSVGSPHLLIEIKEVRA